MDNLHFYCVLMPCKPAKLEEIDTAFLLLKPIIFSDSDHLYIALGNPVVRVSMCIFLGLKQNAHSYVCKGNI